jgi:EAL domain-containing protein (putative c-di-GMP-specific phosphodiesterase class I)
VDDFGTGQSTLPYLKQIPVTSLKIDRPFVASMRDDEQNAQVIRSTIALGRNLGMRVVAEGVETQEILDELRLLGCDLAQGFLLSRPLPADEVEEWIEARERAQAAA